MRFSWGQLFGMAAGEDGEKQAAFRKLHSMLTMSTVHGRVRSEGGCGLGNLPSEFIF